MNAFKCCPGASYDFTSRRVLVAFYQAEKEAIKIIDTTHHHHRLSENLQYVHIKRTLIVFLMYLATAPKTGAGS